MRKPECPGCGSRRVVPIFWGYPTPDSQEGLLAASARGEVALGGCCVPEDPPQWQCPACGRQWREDEVTTR